MSIKLQLSLIIGIMFYLLIIIIMLKKGRINVKYSLVWLVTAFVMLNIAIFPHIVEFLAQIVGISTPVNLVFVIEGFFLLLIVLSLTSIVSMQTNRIRHLIQEQALLEKRVRELEKIIENEKKVNKEK